MSAASDLTSNLAKSRAARDTAVQKLALLRAQLSGIQRQIATAQRLGPGQANALGALQKQAQTLSSQVEQAQASAGQADAAVVGLLGQFTSLADPTAQVGELDDNVPILLFPVRVEVRYRTAQRQPGRVPVLVAPPQPQLWLRIYPDACSVDSFEPLLSDSEVTAVTAFWVATWRAGGVDAQARGAWRTLVGALGSGRAAYAIGQYAPVAPARPAKTNPQDVVLVIVPQTDVTPAEQTAAFTYWTAVWAANGDPTLIAAALGPLQAAVGPARAAELIASFAPDPAGWDPPSPYTRTDVGVSLAVLKLPPPPTSTQTSWTQAARAAAMPDRFVVLAYQGGVEVKRVFGSPIPDRLATTPDPSLTGPSQIQVQNDDLQLNADLTWLADFDAAVAAGMGVRIDLTAAEAAQGFDRLVVVGVRASSDPGAGADLLGTLISHQLATKGGYGIAPQGSAAHNTGNDDAAYSWVDDPDAAYDTFVEGTDAYVESADPLQRRDGQWLAEALGVDPAIVKRVPHAAGVDQAEARAMNVALWNGTLGYMLEEMLPPLFAPADVASTRQFFTRFVTGRGPLPALRVGNQPYGLLPAMAFSRYASQTPGVVGRPATDSPTPMYLQRLHTLLARMDADWRSMAANASHIGQAGDPQQALLDVVGLHAGSVEYHQRYAESFDQLYNKLVLELGQTFGSLLAEWLAGRSQQLLTQLGANPTVAPPILEKFFYGESALLTGPVVDDRPLSESEVIRAYTTDNRNYIQWLTTSSLDAIRQQDFGGNPQPTALLYLMLRHAMMLSQWDAGTAFLENKGLVDPVVARREPSFISVQTGASAGESKFQHLFAAQPAITGDPTTTLAEYVLRPAILATAAETASLREVVAALGSLTGTPTARLERLFSEHVDCCSYRLDAWKTGLATTRLAEMRTPVRQGDTSPRGIYLVAFGWLEDVRPKADTLTPVDLSTDLAQTFQRPGDAPLESDPQNAGYIHAPSLGQAATAAILKNAYRVHASPANPDAMAVNLTSDRVRNALAILEGVRNGQGLPALLGYQFERGLHDAHDLAEVDKFIYPLRQAFPLVANQLASTRTDETVDINLLEASNVIDGVAFVTRLRTSATYPFGLAMGTDPGQIPTASAAEQSALNTEADNLLNLYDALGDVVMSESVYQVVSGNFDRAAANTKAFNQGGHPPEIQVVDTPRRGLSLTHRVTLHLDPLADPTVSPTSVAMTPRAGAEAPLNLWLAGRLPAPEDVVVSVSYATPALTSPTTRLVSQKELGLQPIDVIYLVNLELDQAMAELDDRILQAVRFGADAHPDMTVTINYTVPVLGKVTFFELAALVRSLRTLLLQARPIGPTDMALPLESESDDVVWDDAELANRVGDAVAALQLRHDALVTLQTDPSDVDTYAEKVSAALLETALFGLPQTGTGQIHADVRSIYEAVVAKVRAVVTRWSGQAVEFETLIATWPTLTTDADRFAMLAKAERLIAAVPTLHPPADPNVYLTAVEAQKPQFDTDLGTLQGLLSWNGVKLIDFLAAVTASAVVIPVHDLQPFDISDQTAAVTALKTQVVSRVTSLANDLTDRLADANGQLAAASKADSSQQRVTLIAAAAKRVLGDEALLIPRFVLQSDRGVEVASALSQSDGLLTDLKANGRRLPVDDWLYGLARVRGKLAAWENVSVLGEAFGTASAELTPLQLPYLANDRWMALEFDTASAGRASRLLYTAHFAKPFDPTAEQCGLLLDEWPELVPDGDVLSALTFHFDRPNSQPPQTMLLAVPPVRRGRWSWDDLVATLNETFKSAKSRAVEPAQIDASSYAQFLPATLTAVTLYAITIATNLAMNNDLFEKMRTS